MELEKKKITWIHGLVGLFSLMAMVYGMFNGNWYFLIGGFLLQFDGFNIIHYKGTEIS
jgi:hypothetical protein